MYLYDDKVVRSNYPRENEYFGYWPIASSNANTICLFSCISLWVSWPIHLNPVSVSCKVLHTANHESNVTEHPIGYTRKLSFRVAGSWNSYTISLFRDKGCVFVDAKNVSHLEKEPWVFADIHILVLPKWQYFGKMHQHLTYNMTQSYKNYHYQLTYSIYDTKKLFRFWYFTGI